MFRKIVTRILTGLLVLWLAASAAFVAIHALPGRIEDVLPGDLSYPGLREAIAAQWGLDHSLLWQYGQFLLRLAHADLGTSFVMQHPVLTVLASQLWPTVQLAGAAGALAIDGSASKIVLVVLVCFFPLFVNTVNGLRRADPDLLDACRAFSASRVFLFLHVKLPSAASEIFSGLQIGISLALIGAVVGEFLSSQRGLGYLISSASVNMSVSTMFAGVVLLAVIGVCGAQFVRVLHRRVVFWEQRETRTAESA